MDNMVKFETAPRPMTSGRSGFPYEEIINSLKVLESTKSLVFKQSEINQSKLTYLSNMVRKSGLGRLKRAKIDNKIYLWINK